MRVESACYIAVDAEELLRTKRIGNQCSPLSLSLSLLLLSLSLSLTLTLTLFLSLCFSLFQGPFTKIGNQSRVVSQLTIAEHMNEKKREKAVPEGRGNRAPRDRAGRSPERMKEILDRGDPRLWTQHQQHYHRGISVSVRRIAKLDRIDK